MCKTAMTFPAEISKLKDLNMLCILQLGHSAENSRNCRHSQSHLQPRQLDLLSIFVNLGSAEKLFPQNLVPLNSTPKRPQGALLDSRQQTSKSLMYIARDISSKSLELLRPNLDHESRTMFFEEISWLARFRTAVLATLGCAGDKLQKACL